MQTQLKLFPVILHATFLESDSPKHAWWYIYIEECMGEYAVVKESGVRGSILDIRRWPMKSDKDAIECYRSKCSQKLDPNRKSTRKYYMTSCDNYYKMLERNNK